MAGSKGASSDRKQVFIVGSDDYNIDLIRRSPGSENWELLSALAWSEIQPPSGSIDFDALYRQARESIDGHGGKPDAIIGYLDFPVTSMVSLLSRDYGLTAATPEAVARCEHKYWMRLEQSRVMPEQTPRFAAVNPFDPETARKNVPPFPFWLKPVKGHSSVLGFMVRDEGELQSALHACRQKIHMLGAPFNQFLDHLDDLSELEGVDGNYAIAEELISAERQFTIEAYVRKGKVHIYGIVDSHREGAHKSSFSSYQYPGSLPDDVHERVVEISEKMLGQIGFDNSPFNMEFFWDPESGALHLLEINPRISKSHSPLFLMVDGAAHQRVAIQLSMGEAPSMPRGEGREKMASKFMLRSFEAEGIVRRVPSESELDELRRILPDMEANILVERNRWLSDLAYQDSYSFELAEVFLGGDDEEIIEDAYVRCRDSLEFHIQPMPKSS